MEMESSSTSTKLETLQSLLASNPFPSSITKLSASTRALPSDEDFHFFYNFNQFKHPIKQLSTKSSTLLQSIAKTHSSKPFPDDPDEAYDWLVDFNDQLFEKFDVSVDEFYRVRKKAEEDEGGDGFELVQGKKKKASHRKENSGGPARVPFHIPSIRKPQDEFKILVDNSNEPFQHVWLERNEDGTGFVHPLEKLCVLDFVDTNIGDDEPVKPLALECTPFKIVEEVKELKELAAKLRDVNEFAVDLEHNQYRSFQGLTCLMQISTRMEDFVVDTLKLRCHIGPYLRELFKDPSKKKVMHGADRDILWLQRDFGIYVCNLFDTQQASRILQLERNSLEYLLHHFCGITANKVYQNADWRLRPIPKEMLKYAREDTHYLLHIYDLMRARLLKASTDNENLQTLLLEVYKRSYNICVQLYEKEILKETSYLYIYGLQGAGFNSQQVAIVAALCEWRDGVARAEDESTGFILPNKTLLEIAKVMPVTAGKLRELVKSKHPYVECNLGSVVSIIKRSIQNASAYETAAELLKKSHEDMAATRNTIAADESEVLSAPEYPTGTETMYAHPESLNCYSGMGVSKEIAGSSATSVQVKEEDIEMGTDEYGKFSQASSSDGYQGELSENRVTAPEQIGSTNTKSSTSHSTAAVKVAEATVQVLKKPSRAFGALLGSSGSKKKLCLDPKAETKVEQIKSSVTFQFHSFPDRNKQPELLAKDNTKSLGNQDLQEPVCPMADSTKLEDIISLENDSDQESPDDVPTEANGGLEDGENSSNIELASPGISDEPMSLSELSSSFQSLNGKRNAGKIEKSQEVYSLQLKPFDYATARKQMGFGKQDQKEEGEIKVEGMESLQDSKDRRRKSSLSRGPKDGGTKDHPSVRRRQAFPHTGNRGATFR